MRRLRLGVWLCFLAAAARAQGSPAQLSDVDFGPVVVDSSSPSLRLRFLTPGQLELHEGATRERCHVTALGQGFLWTLLLACTPLQAPDRPPASRRGQWTWLPGGRAWTELFDTEEGHTLAPLRPSAPAPLDTPDAPAPQEPTPLRTPDDLPPTEVPEGTWQGPAQSTFRLGERGVVTLDGYTAQARLRSCLHIQLVPSPEVPCLSFSDRNGGEAAFALLGNFVWVEGRIFTDPQAELELFEGWRNGRYYRTPPAEPKTSSEAPPGRSRPVEDPLGHGIQKAGLGQRSQLPRGESTHLGSAPSPEGPGCSAHPHGATAP